MTGITSYGAYVPFHRLHREEIARAWGGGSVGGERAVANWDEDSVTMAVEAALDCLDGIAPESVDGLFFASTTSPFKEKQAATLIGTATDLRQDILTLDCASTLRSGTLALRVAADAVKAGSANSVLVTAADCRLGTPQSVWEQRLGDGAAALLVGDSNVIASIEGFYTVSNELNDVWRRQEDAFIHTWEDRFVLTQGYQSVVPLAISQALKQYDLSPKDFSKAVLYAPDARSYDTVLRTVGFEARTQAQSLPFDTVGNTGSAFPLMGLVASLEEAKPNDKILLASYGDGCDVFILQVTPNIEGIPSRRGMTKYTVSRRTLPSYATYLSFRGIVATEQSRMPPAIPASTMLWRERDSLLRLHASKCRQCGEVQFPIQRICPRCRSKDQFEQVRLSNSRGKVFSFTLDNAYIFHEPPPIWGIVDLDAECRIRTPITDANFEDIQVEMPVEMTFRKFPREGDIPVYGWKCRPIR